MARCRSRHFCLTCSVQIWKIDEDGLVSYVRHVQMQLLWYIGQRLCDQWDHVALAFACNQTTATLHSVWCWLLAPPGMSPSALGFSWSIHVPDLSPFLVVHELMQCFDSTLALTDSWPPLKGFAKQHGWSCSQEIQDYRCKGLLCRRANIPALVSPHKSTMHMRFLISCKARFVPRQKQLRK